MPSPLQQPSRRRWRPVRLVDIPLETRMKAAAEAAQDEDARTRIELLSAALHPSAAIYYVASEAA